MSKKTSYQPESKDLILVIKELIQKNSIRTQEELKDVLLKKGFQINQTKISRLLHKLGVVRQIENEELVYRLPAERSVLNPSDSLKFVIVSIKHNEVFIVIKTTPGSAQLVASLLDHKPELSILGTVAGDDTVFIAPLSTKKINLLYKQIYQLLMN